MTQVVVPKLGLSDLIAPLAVTEFVGQYWQKRHYHAAGEQPVRARLLEILGSFDVAHLLGLATEITSFAYVADRTDRRDALTPAEALSLYDAGHTLYFTLGRAPLLRDLAATIAREAGISTLSANASVFASRTSGGLRTHFDQNENFTVQLKGTKVWTLWPNTSVDAPVHPFRQAEPFVVKDSGMYIDARVRAADLGAGTEVEMSPGSLLYHPRGSWHATRAASEAISLNVCLEPMTWFDVFLGAASARLVSSTAMRGVVPAIHTADDLSEVARRAGSAAAAAQRALAELAPEDAAEASAVPPGLDADLFTMAAQCKARITPTSRLRRNSLAGIDVTADSVGTRISVSLFLGRLTRHVTLRAPADWARVCHRVLGPEREWVPKKLAGEGVSEDAIVEVARALAAVGALRVVSGKR
jgi:ribosomal protein L16 Arg81 hydroxylase